SIADVPGARIVRKNDFLAVVAEREEHAMRAARQLKAVWTPSAGAPLPDSSNVSQWLRQAKQIHTGARSRGDVDAGLARAAKVVRATYEWPMQNHGMIGPNCAVADVRPDRVLVWSGSQWPEQTRRDLARFLDVPAETVRVIWTSGSGSYGRLS